MKQAISHVEENDLKQTDVINNFGQFYLRIGNKNDEYHREVQHMRHTYEIEKANAADKNDETVERFNTEFSEIKIKLG